MTSFIFLRHGKSQANADNRIATPDTPLTKEGEAQARTAGRQLRGKHIMYIVCSPLLRARKTAEIIARQLKLKQAIVVLDDLRERGFGELEGGPKDRDSAWYATADGELDIEPRGVVIARAEAALAAVKKLAADGVVLAVGHGVSGFYLQQVAAGKRLFDQFDVYQQPGNAKPVTITLQPIQRTSRVIAPRQWLVVAAVAIGVALLIAGAVWLAAQRRSPAADGANPVIPLSPEDYNGDPNLQNAVQKQLQQQSGSGQSGADAGEQLQPAQHGLND